jgi:Mannitol repressor
MGSLRRLKALAKEIPDEAQIRGLLRVIESRHLGSDYAVAVIGASLVERALEVAILARFIPFGEDHRNRLFSFEQKGPLADLAARTRLGLALGLYGDPTFQDLEKIRTIRNSFAHSPSLLSFADEAVAQACSQFNVLDFVFRDATDPPGFKEPPRSSYVSVCLQIAGRLRARIESTQVNFPKDDGVLP